MIIKPIEAKAERISLQEDEKEVAHICIYYITSDTGELYAFLEDIFVEQESRGQGLGTRLIKAAVERAAKQFCSRVVVNSDKHQERLFSLFKKLGFKEKGTEFRIELE
jgi:GNAT superfamily N-acetyltransferase